MTVSFYLLCLFNLTKKELFRENQRQLFHELKFPTTPSAFCKSTTLMYQRLSKRDCTAFTLKYYNALMVYIYSRLDSLESIYEANLKKDVVFGTELWIYFSQKPF